MLTCLRLSLWYIRRGLCLQRSSQLAFALASAVGASKENATTRSATRSAGDGKKDQVSTSKPMRYPKEWKLVALRECPAPESMQICDTPERAVEYGRAHL